MNFLNSNIHNCCGSDDLRPNMQHVYFKDGYAYATNAHILIKESLATVHGFDEEQIKLMNDKYIHKNSFKYLKGAVVYTITENGIDAVYKNGVALTIKFNNLDGFKYPDCSKVLDDAIKSTQDKKKEEFDLKLNPKMLKLFISCLNGLEDAVFLRKPRRKNDAVVVEFMEYKLEDRAALIMPVSQMD